MPTSDPTNSHRDAAAMDAATNDATRTRSSADPDELTIGDFSSLTGLTPKALRLYGAQGLLEPSRVDATNGYRYYHHSQVLGARLIAMLRASEMRLEDIASLLATLATDPSGASEHLNQHLLQLETEHSARRLLIRQISALLKKEDTPMFPVETRHVPAQRVMTMQRRLLAHETDDFIAEAKAAFAEVLNGQAPAGPFTAIFHGIVDHESDGPIEAVMGCSDDIAATDKVGIRTEPAHDIAYTTITKEQWAFPAILAAYDAVACSTHATERPGSNLSCREIYHAEPDDIALDQPICDVAWPLS